MKRPDRERFWEKVNKDGPVARPGLTPCWLWAFGKNTRGYAMFWMCGSSRRAHRVAFELAGHKIPHGLTLRHVCDVRHCVRVSHLALGTQRENMADREDRGRGARGTRNGKSKLTMEKAADIRKRRAAGESLRAVAAMYNISISTVSAVTAGKIWEAPWVLRLPKKD